MTLINIQAEYLFDPAILALNPNDPTTYEDEDSGAVLVPGSTGAVLSVSGEYDNEGDYGQALSDALDLFDRILEDVTFDGDLDSLPDNPVAIRFTDVGALVDSYRTEEPPQDQLAAA